MTRTVRGTGLSHRQHSLHAVPEPPHCHSRVGLSGIHFDLGLQQPETPPIG
ncbi:hypothetical protein ACUN7Z_18345 [Vreelandella venusta]|uniref:hypothetical protein n=1 Tax=Vreelandella venusta TaxID=44935 RepID=UPI00228583AA|nr:hypothetical protein [Halomonas venusta]WAM48350.1 hypothetical protein L0521_16590 [Halomonas venusta]